MAICRGDLSVLFGRPVAEAFVRQYEAAAGQRLGHLPFWDQLTATLALPDSDRSA